MDVKIQLEAGQIGDTVIELFKSLSSEKKEELALSVLKEWLQSPEFFETRSREQLVIEEFRTGKRKLYYSSEICGVDTPESRIRNDQNFSTAMQNYKNSKQILVEDIKNDVVRYYKGEITKQLESSTLINQIKDETFKEIAANFPALITQVMTNVFTSNLSGMQTQIQATAATMPWVRDMTERILQKINI